MPHVSERVHPLSPLPAFSYAFSPPRPLAIALGASIQYGGGRRRKGLMFAGATARATPPAHPYAYARHHSNPPSCAHLLSHHAHAYPRCMADFRGAPPVGHPVPRPSGAHALGQRRSVPSLLFRCMTLAPGTYARFLLLLAIQPECTLPSMTSSSTRVVVVVVLRDKLHDISCAVACVALRCADAGAGFTVEQRASSVGSHMARGVAVPAAMATGVAVPPVKLQ